MVERVGAAKAVCWNQRDAGLRADVGLEVVEDGKETLNSRDYNYFGIWENSTGIGNEKEMKRK